MNEFAVTAKPSKLIPVLIGGGAMTVVSVVPGLSLLNCACCAGIMGGAVLGVWFYKKSFPPELPFTVGDGAVIGALSGIIGGVLTALLEFFMLGLGSAESGAFQDRLEEAFAQAESQATDPQAVEAARELITSLAANPFMLLLIGMIFALIVFVGFGALGGVIGGNIFKTKVVPQLPTEN